MSDNQTFNLKHSDGTSWVNVEPGTCNTDTSLSLPGYGYTGPETWTHIIDQNFLKLLENFSSTGAPNKPAVGQLWFDLNFNSLKVYTKNGWKLISNTFMQDTAPGGAKTGDFWYDSLTNKLAYYNNKTWVYITENGVPNANTITIDTSKLKGTIFETAKSVQDFFDILINFNTPGSILITDVDGKLNVLPISGDIALSKVTTIKNLFVITQDSISYDITGSTSTNPYDIQLDNAWFHHIDAADAYSYIKLSTEYDITKPTTVFNNTENAINLIGTDSDIGYSMVPAGGFMTFTYSKTADFLRFNILDTNVSYTGLAVDENAAYEENITALNINYSGVVEFIKIFNNNTNDATVNVIVHVTALDNVTRDYKLLENVIIKAGNSVTIPRFGVNKSISITSNIGIDVLLNGKIQYGLVFLNLIGVDVSLKGYTTLVSVTGNPYTLKVNNNIVKVGNVYNDTFNIPSTVNTTVLCTYGFACVI